MASFVIAGSSDDCTRELQTLLSASHIDPVDVYTLSKDGGSIGVEDVRQLHSKIALRPIKSITKAVVIQDSHLLTLPAQNALLKALEEPPEHTLIILTAESAEALLPTICSRCQIIVAERTVRPIDLTPALTLITELPSQSIGERLAEAEQIAKNKDHLLTWTATMLSALSQLTGDTKDYQTQESLAHASTVFQEAYSTLKRTNTNPRLALEHCLLTAFPLP